MEEVLDDKTDSAAKASGFDARLNSVEVEVIHLFVQFAGSLGQPRSVAEIYGLLFCSYRPLAMDEFIERLNMSKGSTSQGLKYLQDLGAIRTVYVAADRRTHYESVTELRKVAGRFLRQQILAQFEDNDSRTGKRILPFVLKMLGGE
jgi:DNA-binding transcriptional regulator GbsR (MarR family)